VYNSDTDYKQASEQTKKSFFLMKNTASVCGIVQKIIRGDSSCVDICQAALQRIQKSDGAIGAFISVHPERALERAQALDSLKSDQKRNKPLLGVPVAVKDNICTQDIATTCASRMLKNFVPPYSAAVVDALEQAGAVIAGKTNLDEFAMGSSTETSASGITRNPADTQRIPGGSSGGSAAAVAAGMVPAALGSDTGGSIRQPCGHCGVAGLKPTYGRVSRYGLIAFASSLDQIGPIAADVRDLGLILSVLSAPDSRDSTCAGKPFIDNDDLYSGSVKGLKIGVPGEYFGEGIDAGVRGCLERLIVRLSREGAEMIDVSLPSVSHAIAAYYIICTAEASSNLARYDGVKYGYRASKSKDLPDMYRTTRQEGFGAEVKRRIMLGTYVLSSGYYDAYYLKAAKVRTLIARDFSDAFGRCDAVLSPVAPTTAFKIGEKCDDPLQMYLTDIFTVSANLAGIPGISVPCGNVGGLPVGAQFMAPQWREDTLLKVAFAVQSFGTN
jgi:aspartyl-tRNA(Asn)/glutamyl-tRNA(Gln) amidotransferase subunit A